MRSKLQFLLWAATFAALAGCSGDAVVGGRLDATDDTAPDVSPDTQKPNNDVIFIADATDVADATDASMDADDASDAADVKDVPVDDGPGACTSNADCASSTTGNVCDLITGRCVGCIASSDTCPASQHCDPASNTCVAGCRSDEGCAMMTSDAGVSLSFHTDNKLISCIDQSTEAVNLLQHAAFTWADLLRMGLLAAEASFLPDAARAQARQQLLGWAQAEGITLD